jgi:hypothetical protein
MSTDDKKDTASLGRVRPFWTSGGPTGSRIVEKQFKAKRELETKFTECYRLLEVSRY